MDPLAHTLAGVTLAQAGIKERIGKGCILALVLASNIVDVDIFGTLFFSQPTWAYRRMWTHSVFLAPCLAVVAAFVFSRIYQQVRFFSWLFVFLLGVGLHVLMDLLNSYGVVLFFPFSRQRFELSWVFIIDLYLWGILLVALLLPWLLRRFGKHISIRAAARIGLFGLFAYMALCGALQLRSRAILAEKAKGREVAFQYVFPEPFGPWRFRGVLREQETYQVFLIEPLRNSIVFRKAYSTDERKPGVVKLTQLETGKKYQWFFKAPLWERRDAHSAVVSDLRFKSLLLERKNAFTYLVAEDVALGAKPPEASPKEIPGGE